MDINERGEEELDLSYGLRRSRRGNKGVPPRKFPEVGDTVCKKVVSDSIHVQNTAQKRNYNRTPRAASENVLNGKEYIAIIAPIGKNTARSEAICHTTRSEAICSVSSSNQILKNDNKSVSSKKSCASRLNLELKLLEQQKQLDKEEAEAKLRAIEKEALEKLRAIEKRRKTALRENEIQMQLLLEASEKGSEVQSNCSENMYDDPYYISKWIEAAKSVNPVIKEPTYKVSNKSASSSVGSREEKESKLLLDIAKQCVQNTANTTHLLMRKNIRELPSFSGEITDWPIFICEYNRSTENYKLTEYDNLLRLDRALKGRARETVKALLTSPDNVPKVIKMLEMNFGRSDWIVLSLMDKVRKFGYVKEDKIESCMSFCNAINNMVTTMKNLNSSVFLYNPEMLAVLVEKLPPIQKYNWGKFKQQKDLSGPTSLEDFATWYEAEIGTIAVAWNPCQKFRSLPKKETVMAVRKSGSIEERNKCPMCKEEKHAIEKCKNFLQKSVEERRQTVSELRLCFVCLKAGHMVNRCYVKKRCGFEGCKGRHNNLLHLDRNLENKENKTQENIIPTDFCANLSNRNETVLLRVAPVILRGPGKEVSTFALFDEGSTCTMLEEELAEMLELPGSIVPLCFQWTNEITHHEDNSRVVSVKIAAEMKHPTFYMLKNVRTVHNLSLPRQKIDAEFLSKRFPYLDPIILKTLEDAAPKMLIGQDNCGLIVPRQVIQPRLNLPVMSKWKLGWTIHGAVSEYLVQSEPIHVNLCCQHFNDEKLHLMIKDSFKLEDFGIKMENKVIKSVEDKRAVVIMEKTIRKVGSRFEIGHLYRQEDFTFPESKVNALRRLTCMERKMSQNQEFSKQYCQKIEEYVRKGYCKKLEDAEITKNPKDWYLPHFAVWNINKPGKIRLVFDAAAKSFGYSLNDFLLQGPDFVPSLVAVLWRFRQGQIAFSGDIKEMFHQVIIRQENRCSQRFFWREDINKNPNVYQMNVMIFGAVSSPSVAQFVKNRNAEEYEHVYPGIERAIKRQHYVDDYLDSCNTIDAAIERVKNIIFVHKQAGFEMTKWTSNSELVMNAIPEDLRAETSSNLKIDSEKIERVLGLSWCPKTDKFVFNLHFEKIPQDISSGKKVPTKREVLRIVMSIFDPLGFLGPLIIKARILLQNIWRSNIDWDNEIPTDLYNVWYNWLQELQTLAPIYVNRYYFPGLLEISFVDLHLFSDAGDKAYAAVAFIRVKIDNKIFTSFVSAKYKVAPINQQTIPKLELQGAVLACRIAKTLCNELEYKIRDVYFWTDSMVVLKQIRSEGRRFPIFVACRLGEIHENTSVSQWHWVSSEQNVADLATKEIKKIDFSPTCDWFTGPKFLKQSENFWPREPECENMENTFVVVSEDHSELNVLPDTKRFSKWMRLLRATGWILNFVKILKLKKNERQNVLQLNVTILEQARNLLIRKCQSETFPDELHMLRKEKVVKKDSRLFKLSPFLDENGIIRLKGRFPETQRLHLEYDIRNPIILDPKHKIVDLLIQYYHEKSGHIGVETVVNNLRLKFWILRCRTVVKKCFNNCQTCRIRRCKPVVPEMGFLPQERLEPFVFPFSYVGIDFFGPMTVSIGRRIEKRYGVLFTCLSIRAVHIELASSLDTSSTILAIRRFMSRRGQPIEIITDNGTNFVGAERELREWVESLNQSKIQEELSVKGILWKFNVPAASSMGGVWERLVRSVKNALKIVLKTVNPKEVLRTLLTEVEYTVNSRPLVHVSIDPDEPEAITPNHFLILRAGDINAYGEPISDVCSRKQWRFAEALANLYWKRWVIEYRPTLIARQKWHSKTEPVKIGDVVVIVDERAPRNQWKLGRIDKVFPGKDGIIRVALVKTSTGNYVRPVSKLCVMPCDEKT